MLWVLKKTFSMNMLKTMGKQILTILHRFFVYLTLWYNTPKRDLKSNSSGVEIPCLTCPTWSHFIQDNLKNYIYLSRDKKPADLNLHCFQLSLYLVSYYI